MNIVVERFEYSDKSTIGRLLIDDVLYCYTLEDVDRRLEDTPDAKIAGETAIPRGVYKVIIDFSNRFKAEMPHLLDVPGFTGVRIHSGNSSEDTEGCLLVGSSFSKDWVSNSRATFQNIFDIMEEAYAANEAIELEIT